MKSFALIRLLVISYSLHCLLYSNSNDLGSKILYLLQANENAESKTAFISKLANTDRDLIVLDYSFEGSFENRWSSEDLNKIRGQQKNRKIVCYLSIGEAEDYRYYWKKTWNRKNKQPFFLLDENKDWKGNYLVKYWDPDWQNIIRDYIRIILIDIGFDGLFLDIVDGYERFEYDKKTKEWIDYRENPETKQSYRKDMVEWIQEIRLTANANNPRAMIIAQNATALTLENDYNILIDAISTEDLFLHDGKWKPNQTKIELLNKFKQLGKKVYCVEYTDDRKLALQIINEANILEYHPLITNRALTSFGINKME